jgi:hypothetical protein
MNKPIYSTAAAAFVALGLIVTGKTIAPMATGSLPPVVMASARVASAMPDMTPIVPSPVIDTRAEMFVGAGDNGAGAWVGP